MPNDCVNHVTLYAGPSTIKHLVEAGPALADLIVGDVGDLRLYDYKVRQVGKEAMIFTITSAWVPANPLFEALIQQLDITFLKNEWYIEDGMAGVWIGESRGIDGLVPKISALEWDEGCLEEKVHRFRNSADSQ
jgi:hypothetical protein